jgi:hypothetical protein
VFIKVTKRDLKANDINRNPRFAHTGAHRFFDSAALSVATLSRIGACKQSSLFPHFLFAGRVYTEV